jgi:hypothetical protein
MLNVGDDAVAEGYRHIFSGTADFVVFALGIADDAVATAWVQGDDKDARDQRPAVS